MDSIVNALPHVTARIECTDIHGQQSVGTGFYFRYMIQGKGLPVLVTNRHVISGAARGQISVHFINAKPYGPFGFVEADKFEEKWIMHPDKSVDLRVLPLPSAFADAEAAGSDIFYTAFSESMILAPEQEEQELRSIEDIIMIGYPSGLWDTVHNLPIVRRGITATSPCIDYNGKPEFLIDAACFPGSSGSPVLLYNPIPVVHSADENGAWVEARLRANLLGILFAGPLYVAEGEMHVVELPTRQSTFTLTGIPQGLGKVIKARRLLDFIPLLESLVKTLV